MRVNLLLVLFFCWVQFGYSQIDSILALRGTENRQKGFIDWASKNIFWNGQQNQERKLALMKEATESFRKVGDEKLIREAWFFSELAQIGGAMSSKKPWEQAANHMLVAADIAHKREWGYNEVECRMAASAIYFNANNPEKGFEQAYIAEDIIEKIGLDAYPEAGRFLAEIAGRYYSYTDYETAVIYFRKALSVRQPWRSVFRLFDVYNTFALSFRRQEKYDSAIYYFQQAHLAAVNEKNVFWSGFTNGNLGYLYCDLGMYDEALPLLLNDFEVSNVSGQSQSAAKVAIALATVYIHKKDVTTAEKFINYSRQFIDTTTLLGKTEIYDRLSRLYRVKGDYRKAFIFLDSAVYFNNMLSKQQNVKVIGHAKFVNEAQNHAAQVRLMESREEMSQLVRKGIVIAVASVCVITVLLIGRIRARKNSALKTAMLEKKLIADDLLHARLKLQAFTNLLMEKNKLVEELKGTLNDMQLKDEAAEAEIAFQLTQTTLLTEGDWKRFRELFDKVEPGFFIRLKEKIKNISRADLRLSALMRLNLSTKEMASILGISCDAVRKGRQRLHAKTDLDGNLSIEEIIDSI